MTTAASEGSRPILPPARVLIGLLISAVSLVAVVYWALQQATPQFPDTAREYVSLAAALLLYAVITVIRGWRWHRILLLAGVGHRPRDAYGLTVVGYMGNTVLPARGGELLRVFLLGERTDARRREILGTIVAERFLDAVALVALFAVMTWARIAEAPAGQAPAALSVLAAVVGGLLVAGYVRHRRRGRFERFAAAVRPFVRATKLIVSRTGFGLAVLTVVVWCLEGGVWWLIADSLGIELSLVEATFVVVLASFFALIPAAPGYVGTFDAGIAFALAALDVPGGQIVAFVILVRFIVFLPITIAGLLLLLFGYGGFRRSRPDQDELSEPVVPGRGDPPLYTDFLEFERRVFGEPPPIAQYDPFLIRYGEYRFILGALPIEPGVSVVDVGCETNVLMLFLATRGAEVTGIDVDPELRATVEERKQVVQRVTGIEPSLRFQVQDATALDLEPGSADIVVATSSIEHMFSDEGNGDELAVDGIARVLRPGGVAAITVPMSNGTPFHESPSGDDRFAGPYRLYTPATLTERFLSHPDLETVRHNYLAHATPDPHRADRHFFRFWLDQLSEGERLKWSWANPILSAVFNPIVGAEAAEDREESLNTALLLLRKRRWS